MASTFVESVNDFGLPEKTLTTEGKWCTADIDVKVDLNELQKINPEYLRSGVEVFGVTGEYGEDQTDTTVKIPAGVYEIIFNLSDQVLDVQGIDFIYVGEKYTGVHVDYAPVQYNLKLYNESGDLIRGGEFNEGSSARDPYVFTGHDQDACDGLRYLVLVPAEQIVSYNTAKSWYSLFHPAGQLNHSSYSYWLDIEYQMCSIDIVTYAFKYAHGEVIDGGDGSVKYLLNNIGTVTCGENTFTDPFTFDHIALIEHPDNSNYLGKYEIYWYQGDMVDPAAEGAERIMYSGEKLDEAGKMLSITYPSASNIELRSSYTTEGFIAFLIIIGARFYGQF